MHRETVARVLGGAPAERDTVVCGWVRTLRRSKAVAFLALGDGSSQQTLQVVLDVAALANFEEVSRLPVGTAVRVEGRIVPTPGAVQPLELRAAAVQVVGACDTDYPLQKKRHTLEYLRTMPHLRARTNTIGAAMRVRSALALAIHRFFEQRGFVYVHTPLITTSDCEGAGELFRVTTLDPAAPPRTSDGGVDWTQDFFGKPTALTVSGQLAGESLALALGNIYTFGPTFRAENSHTPRHAAEFWMIEPEMAFADLRDDQDLARDMLSAVVAEVLDTCADDLTFFDARVSPGLLGRLRALVDSAYAAITYTEAIEQLTPHASRFTYPVIWGCDLQTEHERFLSEEVFGGPVFVTDYPREIKAFYMRRNDDGRTVAAMDLLVPGVGELIGGSQREDRADVLLAAMQAQGLDPAAYDWYVQLRRYGGVPHAGFGLGFERLVMLMTGLSNIRDVIPYPRTAGSAEG